MSSEPQRQAGRELDDRSGLAVDVEDDRDLPSWRQLQQLSDNERTVYQSVEMGGLTPSELADFEPWDASTIRTHLHRARQKLGELDEDTTDS